MASMDAKDDPSHAKPALPLLLAPAALYLFSVSLLFPVFPSLLKFALPAGVPERGAETTALYGLLQQIKAVLDLFTLPVLGRVSDYVGRKPVTLWCLVLALLQLLLITPPSRTGAAPETYHACLVASRVLGGMSDGVLVLLFASLTDVADGAALPVLFGRVGLVFGCAFTLGPLTAALLLARSGEVAVLLLSACCTLLALLLYAGTRRQPLNLRHEPHRGSSRNLLGASWMCRTETLLAARRSRLPTSLTAQFLLYFSPVYQLQQVCSTLEHTERSFDTTQAQGRAGLAHTVSHNVQGAQTEPKPPLSHLPTLRGNRSEKTRTHAHTRSEPARPCGGTNKKTVMTNDDHEE